MDRRTFATAGASLLAVAASGAAAKVTARGAPSRGEMVTLTGSLTAAEAGPGHYFVLAGGAQTVGSAIEAPQAPTLVFPAAADSMRAGQVRLRGRLHRGRFKDEVTGRAAGYVLTGATLV